MDKRDSQYCQKWAKKIKAINYLGGKCYHCGNNNAFCLDFHHKSDKTEKVSKMLDARWSDVFHEIKKCILLCQNCHRKLHRFGINKIKKKLLELKGVSKCEMCGYDKNYSSLLFHHIDPLKKSFHINAGITKEELKPEKIILEMDKCMVVCANCHSLIHIDDKKFESLYKEINARVINMTELQKPVSREEVKNLIGQGYSQIYIAKKLGCSDSTINGIVSKLKLEIKKPSRLIKFVCINCNKEFVDYKSKRNKFCSRECFRKNKWHNSLSER